MHHMEDQQEQTYPLDSKVRFKISYEVAVTIFLHQQLDMSE